MSLWNISDEDDDIIDHTEDEDSSKDDSAEEEEFYSATVTEKVAAWLWFFFKIAFSISIVLIIVVTGAVIGILKGFSEKIPMVADTSYRPNLTTQVFDTNGDLIVRLHAEENRTRILSASEIPGSMKHAVIAVEDERFYSHYGIDILGIMRAMLTNLKAGRIVQGASTLTQQLVKNAFLTSERTFQRKAIEAMMAFQLERKYSKDEILTLYLNEIYFGHGAYGLAAASELYFGKDPLDLTLTECVMLASIPRSPIGYSPVRNPANNKARRGLVLSKMVELGYITPAQFEQARNDDPPIKPLSRFEMKAPFFATYVRDQLIEKYGAALVYTGGLKVYTTLDLRFQEYAEQVMASAPIFLQYPIDKYPLMNGSLVTLDPKNGHIKAMYGGRSFEQSQFNRVTQAKRQPGSSFKPFVYAAALEEGMLPGDMIKDEPISYTNPWTKQVWAPRNYDNRFHGNVTLMKALCKSFNVPAVKLIEQLSPTRVIRLVKRLGVYAHLEPNLSLALGSNEFSPLEMASAYGVIANNGIYVTPLSILRVVDRDGNILEENMPRGEEVMDSINAAMLTDMLRIAVERGTGRSAMINGRVVAGKTGTTNNYIDAWFNGITPELVTILQFGFDMNRSLGSGKSGGGVCGPVWKQYMEKVLEHYPKSDFPVPEGAVRLRVCMTSGDLASSKCPSAEIVSQIYPVDSKPSATCSHGRYIAPVAVVDAQDSEGGFIQPNEFEFTPDPSFFRGDYQNSPSFVTSATRQEPPTSQNAWIQRNPQPEQVQHPVKQTALQRWGAEGTIPAEAFLDRSMADIPAVDPRDLESQPGNTQQTTPLTPQQTQQSQPVPQVIKAPEVIFRSDYR